jgi:Protein of unknown function (DUF3034)
MQPSSCGVAADDNLVIGKVFMSNTVVRTLSIALAFLFAPQPAFAQMADAEGPENNIADAELATAEAGNQAESRTDDSPPFYEGGGRLLLTGGVSQIEGSTGGGLTPWALIGGYGTRDEFGATAFVTGVNTRDFSLTSFGGQLAYGNRFEFSIARQSFNLNAVGAALGLGREFSIRQTVVGAKVRLIGDAVLEQDSILPQIAVGAQYKKNDEAAVLGVLGARNDEGVDFYASATKIILSQGLLLNGTARLTKANQFGILGFGGPTDNSYELQAEGTVSMLLTRKVLVGVEFRTKPDKLGFKEDSAFDAFVAFAPTRNVSITLAYVDLGNIALRSQRGAYASLQIGF